MDISTKISTKIYEETECLCFREQQLKIVKDFFTTASAITVQTPQNEICKLLANVANYTNSAYKQYYFKEAHDLQLKLSACLSSKYTGKNEGFNELSKFLKTHNEFIIPH